MRLVLRHGEVAMDIMIFCARHRGTRVKTVPAAEFAGAAGNFARQVVVLPRRPGLIVTVRGPRGGIALAGGAQKARIGAIPRIGAILGLIDPASNGRTAAARHLLERLTVGARDAACRTFDRSTVEELPQDVAAGRTTCRDPALPTPARSPRPPHDVPAGEAGWS